MTIASTTSRVTFAGDAVTTSFATSPVKFYATSDLQVRITVNATGVSTLLTENTHYAVTGGSVFGATGTVNLAGGSSPHGAVAVGQTLVITRVLAQTQSVDFVQNDTQNADVAETALDKLTCMVQQLQETLMRSFTLDAGDVSGASLTVPTPTASTLIGWNATKTALQNYVPAALGLLTVSAFIGTMLDDVDAATARATLGAQQDVITTTGDIIVGTANAAGRLAIGTDGYEPRVNTATAKKLQYLPPNMGHNLLNGYLDWSVAANALTIAVKTFAGTDPTADDPVFALVRSATSTTGLPVIRKLTAALSITVPNTALLGTINATAFKLWAVLFDDAATLRLGVINTVSGTNIYPLQGWNIASSTAVDTASDNAQVFYTNGAGVTSKAYSVLGYATWESGQATAGTWATAASRIQLWNPSVPLPGVEVQSLLAEDNTMTTGTTQIPADDTIPQNTEGDQKLTRAVTPTSAANILIIEAAALTSSNGPAAVAGAALFQDSGANAIKTVAFEFPAANIGIVARVYHRMLAAINTSTTFNLRFGSSTASTFTFNGINATRYFGGTAAAQLLVREIAT